MAGSSPAKTELRREFASLHRREIFPGQPCSATGRSFAEAGGLLSYGADDVDLYRRAGYFVDRILKGTKPADLPVEQPTRFELVINLNTAQALFNNRGEQVLALASRHAVPAIYPWRDLAAAGGLNFSARSNAGPAIFTPASVSASQWPSLPDAAST